jgi:hypothetical protein
MLGNVGDLRNHNPKVEGSNPPSATNHYNKLHALPGQLRPVVWIIVCAQPVATQQIANCRGRRWSNDRGVAAVYNRHEYRAEQRAALLAWGERLSAIVFGTT